MHDFYPVVRSVQPVAHGEQVEVGQSHEADPGAAGERAADGASQVDVLAGHRVHVQGGGGALVDGHRAGALV